MKIPDNSMIDVHGWVMLKKVDCKRYRVRHGDGSVYWFFRPRGKKPIIGHYGEDVDCWVKPKGHPNNNRIEVLS